MKRSVVSGICEPIAPQSNTNGFVNRGSSVQLGSSAPDSDNSVTKGESSRVSPLEAGFLAAKAAGRRPVDSINFGAVDRVVLAEIGRYQAIRHKRKADRERLRAALIPFIQGAS